MKSRQLLRYRDARRIAGQDMTYSGLSGGKLNRDGAFQFKSAHFGPITLIDDNILSAEERAHLVPLLAHHHAGISKPGVMLNEDLQIRDFITYADYIGETPAGRRAFTQIKVWHFRENAWCLPHILVGITSPDRDDDAALACYDRHFATSAHGRMRARQRLSDWRSAS